MMPLWVFLLLSVGAIFLLGLMVDLTRQRRHPPTNVPPGNKNHSLDDGYDLRDWDGFH